MKYRSKLLLAFSLTLILSTSIALIFSFYKSHSYIFDKLRSQLVTVAASSAASISGKEVAKFKNPESTKTQDYQKLLKQLRFIRDSNRRKDLFLSYVYIVKVNPEGNVYFIADAEEDPKNVSLYGDEFNEIQELKFLPSKPFCLDKEIKDQWGVWFSAYAPIYNEDGSIQAYLGIDKEALFLHTELDAIAVYYIIGLCFALCIGSIVVHFLSKSFTSRLNLIYECVEKIEEGDLTARVNLNTADELGDLSKAINHMAYEIQEKERITIDFGRYVSKHVLEKILSSSSSIKLEGERKKVTILFSDIREFTKRSEGVEPSLVVHFLNQYFEEMIQIIFHHFGILDKFIGDALMAEFGIPEQTENQETLACKAALDMQDKIKELSEKWKETPYENLRVGIGVHTGEAVVGNIGTSFRMEYTAVGDSVNIANSLEILTKEVKKDVLISQATYLNIKDHSSFRFESLGKLRLPKSSSVIEVFHLTRAKKN